MNPVKTLCFTLSLVALLAVSAAAQNKTLYFYPPDMAKWISGRSYIYDMEHPAKPLELVDPKTDCGWYKITLSASDPLLDAAQIWLGSTGVDKIGPMGKQSDDPKYEGGTNYYQLGGFELRNIFGSNNAMYFVADEIDPDNPSSGWYTTRPSYIPTSGSRCSFDLAAFIYDTDMSVHPDFSCGEYAQGTNDGNGPDTKRNCTLDASKGYSNVDAFDPGGNKKATCTGVQKNVVKPTLDANRKMQYNEAGDVNKCWTSGDWFNKAFNPTEGVNVVRCYDMPFKQRAGGSFEFSSDSMLNASGRLIGGFYPLELQSMGDADYSKCPNCAAKRPAESFAPLIKWVTADILENYTSQQGDFKNGDSPTRAAFGSATGITIGGDQTKGIWNWADQGESPNNLATETRQGMNWYLHGTTAIKGSEMAPVNGFFCFESHTSFVYDPEQTFVFRGDDDIWVYINNKLVIDLGGTHLAAPGKVRLDTLGLIDGKEYPIDIFFCDKRTTMSNVRINTNMYVSSAVKFSPDPDYGENKNYMCASVKGGSDCKSQKLAESGNITGDINACGPDIPNKLKGWTVDFYILRRGNVKDTIWLSLTKNPDNECKGSEKDFTCYGGIRIEEARYSCGGEVRCQGNPTAAGRVTFTGNANVFARLKDEKGVPQGRTIQIDQFKSEIHLNMVWGNLVGSNNAPTTNVKLDNAYGETSSKEQWIIAGKRSPIYIASGEWNDPPANSSFTYDDPYSGLPSDAAGRDYTVNIKGGDGLKIYKSKTGSEEGRSGKLPSSGIDTLWIEGSYTIGEKEFELDVTGSEPLKIHIYQPKLEIRDAACTAKLATTDGYAYFNQGDPNPPYVGTPLNICLAAVDEKRSSSLCDHCVFNLTQSSTTTNSTVNSMWGDGIVTSPDNKISNGTLKTSMQGWDQICEIPSLCTQSSAGRAEWSVFGPSKDLTNAKWTGLQFILPPVPMPRNSFIYDRNGDGIADSIRIEFNKAFKSGGEVIDSLLPALVEVIWAEKDTIRFHHPNYNWKDLKSFDWMKGHYDNAFRVRNAEYWRGYVKGDSLIVIAPKDTMFSKEILTVGFKDGKGQVFSSTPFNDADGVFTYQAAQSPVQDRVPPIVVKAVYEYKATSSDCMTSASGCYQKLEVTLSEMVFPIEGATTEQLKDPFSYCFGFSQAQDNPGCPLDDIKPADRHDQNWRNDWKWELPAINAEDAAQSANYLPNTRSPANTMSSPKGDNVVNLAYYARNTSYGTSRMPKANDWIKIRTSGSAYKDAADNGFNPREIGIPISGTNPTKKKQINISTITGNKDDKPLGGVFESRENLPPWINPNVIGEISNGLFRCEDNNKENCKVAELLPVPPNLDGKALEDAIRTYYPGSVGTVFQGISERIARDVDKLDSICNGQCKALNGGSLKSDDPTQPYMNAVTGVTIYASADYHTNIGNYVAHRPNFGLACNAPIFQDASGVGNCLDNPNSTPPVGPHLYLAWDLKANTNRFVGAGAYVGISKFYWEIKYIDQKGNTKTKKIGEDEFIEMYGVKRKAR